MRLSAALARLKKDRLLADVVFGAFSVVLACVFTYLATHKRPGLTLSLALGLVVFGVTTQALLRRPQRALALIFFLLPFYPFLRIQILRFQIVGSLVMFAVSRWPEFLMLLALLGRKLGGIRRIFYAAPLLDLLTTLYLLLGILFLVRSVLLENWMMGLWGFKEHFLFFLFYFLVRFLPVEADDLKRILSVSAIIAAAIAAFGCIQAQFFGQDFLLKLGYGIDYQNTGLTYLDPNYSRRFPGGLSFVRAISILQDALSLGAYLMIFLLLLYPFCFLPAERSRRPAKLALYLVLLAGLLYTTTRSAWIGTAAGILFLAWKKRRLFATTGTFLVVGLFFLLLLLGVPGGYEFLEGSLFTGKESSAVMHWSKYGWQFRVMLDNPLGLGLGMTGRTGIQFGSPLIGGFSTECWYLQVGTQMGLAGFFLYLALVLETLRKLFLTANRLRDPWLRDLAGGIFAAYLACSLFGISLNVWSCHVIPVFMHLLVGISLFHLPRLDAPRPEGEKSGSRSIPPAVPSEAGAGLALRGPFPRER